MPTDPIHFEIDVSAVAPAGADVIAGDVFVDDGGSRTADHPLVLVVCVPGGGMTRRYFDLRVPPGFGLGNYSMARHLAAQGFVLVTLDPPGVGESAAPDDGYALTPDVVAGVLAGAVEGVRERLRAGALSPALPRIETVASIGIGHSMGGLLTVHQQARHGSHDAIAVLGFAGGGLVDALTEEERAYAGDPVATRRELGRLAAARFGRPFPISQTATSPFLLGTPVPELVEQALGEARGHLIAVSGLASMIPGNADPELARIDVPVFIGVGTLDITGDPFRIPPSFARSPDITLFVLDGAGHNHNAAQNRERLWDRLVTWGRAVTLSLHG